MVTFLILLTSLLVSRLKGTDPQQNTAVYTTMESRALVRDTMHSSMVHASGHSVLVLTHPRPDLREEVSSSMNALGRSHDETAFEVFSYFYDALNMIRSELVIKIQSDDVFRVEHELTHHEDLVAYSLGVYTCAGSKGVGVYWLPSFLPSHNPRSPQLLALDRARTSAGFLRGYRNLLGYPNTTLSLEGFSPSWNGLFDCLGFLTNPNRSAA